MPTIAAGQTLTTTLVAGTRFGMGRGNGTYRVGPLGTSAAPTVEELIDPEGTWIGPFGDDCALTVRATTAVTYTVLPIQDALLTSQVVGGLLDGTSAANKNTALIQSALNVGGLVQIPPGLGDVYITQTGVSGAALTIAKNTRFVVGHGSCLRLAPGANCNILRNANWASAANTVTQLSTADAGITISVQAATLPAVGSYVIILGAAQRVYNNAYRVLTSGGGVFTAGLSTRVAPAESPTTPATGTITWRQADENIVIEGEFNYDTLSQTTPDTWLKHAIYLRRIVNASFDVTVKDATKYALALGNVYQSTVRRAYFDTISDGIHLIGSWDDVYIGTVQGKTGDDMVAAGNSDYAAYLDAAHAVGDGGALKVESIICDGSLTAFKYFGCSTNVAKSIQIGTVQGRISGGSGFVNLINDTGATNGTSSTLERCEIGSIVPAEPVSTAVLQTAGAITVQNFKVERIDTALNNNTNARALLVGASSVISKLRLDVLNLNSSAYAGSSFGVYVIGTLADSSIGHINATNIGLPVFFSGSATGTRMQIDNFITNNCGQAWKYSAAGSFVLAIKHIERNGYQSSPHIDLSNSSGGITFTCQTAVGLTGTDALGGTGANKTILYSPQLAVDVGGIVRQAGALVYHNSGTARGTLVNFNVCVCDATNAANSWKQLSDTTKTF